MTDFIDELAADSLNIPEVDDLSLLTELVKKHLTIENEIEMMVYELAIKQGELRNLSEKIIPEIFERLNLEEIKLNNGVKVNVKPFYAGTITAENQPAAFTWLKENEHDDLIKNELKLTFGKGEEETCLGLMESLEVAGYNFVNKKSVHPQTLKAFIKEQIEAGNKEFSSAMDLFSVHIGKQTKIKIPKGGIV
jgi:hypothetical protein